MNVFDVAFAFGEDMVFEKGDFKLIESTAQHIGHMLIAQKGEYRRVPTFGAEIKRGLSDDGSLLELQGNIQDTLEQDGLNVKELQIDGKINIDAVYK